MNQPDTIPDTVEALDFDPVCTTHIPANNPQCGRPAAWMVIKHCGHTGFTCNPCRDYLLTSLGLFRCQTCGQPWDSPREATEWVRL